MSATAIALYDDPIVAQKVGRALNDISIKAEKVHVFLHDETGALEGRSVREHLRGETGGVGTSAFTGDFINTLVERGVPRDEAEFYAEGVRRGGGVVMVFDADDHRDHVTDIMNRHEPVHRKKRLSAWQEHGYADFNEAAALYTMEEAKAERKRYAEHPAGTVNMYS